MVAESVSPGYPRALNKTICDPCFAARYLDQYRDGRVRAIDDIYAAGMSKCYIEQLETLAVKANLVTPILNQGQLYGLLVAHQCSQPRPWQDYEIRWVTQIATQVGFALDHAQVLAASSKSQIKAETARKWGHYLSDAVQYIRQSTKTEEILEISVEEVRRILECDRVVVYSLNQDQYGVVVAESVSPGYPRALNKTICDPCFAARYLDQYRDGRVRAIDDIYAAGMSKCYIEQLETLAVKANLVTPILNQGQLYGLLVAHQCSQPRPWQDYEICWVTQIATQVGFALDHAKLLQKLKQDGLPMQLLNNFSLAINERIDSSKLLQIAVEQARQVIKLDRVIVYQFDSNDHGNIVAESVAPGYPRTLNFQLEDFCLIQEYAAKYRQGRKKAIANIHQANSTTNRFKHLETLAVKASLVVPILQNEELFGLLIGHQCQQPRLWSQSEIDLLTQLALQLGFALERIKLTAALNLAKDIAQNRVDQQQSQSLIENQATRHLEAKNHYLSAPGDFLTQMSAMGQTSQAIINGDREQRQQLNHGALIPQPQNTQRETDLISANGAIVAAGDQVKVLNQSHRNLGQMVNLVNDMKEPTKFELDLITGQFVEPSPSAPNLTLMNQFVGEISNLSAQISQQSLLVTESFQKLATFAKQLSEREQP